MSAELPGQTQYFVGEINMLLGRLNMFASMYSDDFAAHVEDGCFIKRGGEDLGSTLRWSMSFLATRIRATVADPPDYELKDAHIYEYEIESDLQRRKLKASTLPKALINFLMDEGNYPLEDIVDSNQDFGVGIVQRYNVSSVGRMEYSFWLNLWVGEDSLAIPSDYYHSAMEELSIAYEDQSFSDVFSSDEIKELRNVSTLYLQDSDASVVISKYAELLSKLDDFDPEELQDQAKNLAAEVFDYREDDDR